MSDNKVDPVIEFRFPGGRWEPVPAAYSVGVALALYANYDLRVDGKVYPRGWNASE